MHRNLRKLCTTSYIIMHVISCMHTDQHFFATISYVCILINIFLKWYVLDNNKKCICSAIAVYLFPYKSYSVCLSPVVRSIMDQLKEVSCHENFILSHLQFCSLRLGELRVNGKSISQPNIKMAPILKLQPEY